MSNALATTSIIEDVIAKGDLKALSPEQRSRYYTEVCTSMGLNPMTKPFDYLTLNGKLQLYATKGATDQLRRIHGIGITVDSAVILNDIYTVTVTAMDANGRKDSDIGAISIKGLQGDNLANAMMKAITKAKRRVTMSMCGLGMLDETEVDAIPHAQRVHVDDGTIRDVTPEQPHVPQIAPQSTETDDTTDFEDRLADALEMPKEPQKRALNNLQKEAMTEKHPDKLRLLIKFVPDFQMAEWILNTAADKHGVNTPEMVAALDERDDNPNVEQATFAEVE
jgi:hypothetical protein